MLVGLHRDPGRTPELVSGNTNYSCTDGRWQTGPADRWLGQIYSQGSAHQTTGRAPSEWELTRTAPGLIPTAMWHSFETVSASFKSGRGYVCAEQSAFPHRQEVLLINTIDEFDKG